MTTGYVLAHSACFGCHKLMSYNPVSVPSCIDPSTGKREPICIECVTRVNPMRIANGLPPIVPKPDAYDACEEDELR